MKPKNGSLKKKKKSTKLILRLVNEKREQKAAKTGDITTDLSDIKGITKEYYEQLGIF